jgi:hypothetical protein
MCSCNNGKFEGDLHGCPPPATEGGSLPNRWTQGAPCIPGSLISYGSSGEAGPCLTICDCQANATLQCITDCRYPFLTSPLPDCGEGKKCMPGEGCSGGVLASPTACLTGCACDESGQYRCTQSCPNVCGLPETSFCRVCRDGMTHCEHDIFLNGACALEICPEDGPIMGI